MIEEHAGGQVVDAAVVHEGSIDDRTLERYRAEGTRPLEWPDECSRDIRVFRSHLVGEGPKLRHDPVETAEALVAAWEALSAASRSGRSA